MSDTMTKSQARHIFYGGSLAFLVIFVGLTIHSHLYINCHTLLGEGAYFAPELGNVWQRYGGVDDPEGARDALKAWMESQPSGVEGRRQMPNFNLSAQELDDLIDFLEWVSRIDTQNWPPNDAG